MRILRYVLGFLIILLIIVVLVNLIFGGKKSKTDTTKTVVTQATYADSAETNSSVSMLIAGVINGADMHRQIRVTVNNNTRTLDILDGYSGKILSTQSYPNTQEAYREFLSAIYTSGYTKENPANVNPDVSGRCPLGTRYIYSSAGIPNVPDELWTTSCPTVIGTFGGVASAVTQLFQLQIPNYTQQTSNVNLAATK